MRDALLVEPDWAAARLGRPDIVAVDASWHMPGSGRDAKAEHRAAHLPGAVFFDVDTVADPLSDLPHMLPSPAQFAQAMGGLGLREDMTAIVYDSIGLFSAPRVWWTLRAFGMRSVVILAGGLPRWMAEGRPVESGQIERAPAVFTPRFDSAAVASREAVLAACRDEAAVIVDARARDRFTGAAPEPRPGLRSGHIPGSRNLPWTEILDGGGLADAPALARAFDRVGADGARPIVTTCGSGVSAAILSFALATLGRPSAVYDGSWTEWGAWPDAPVAAGED